MSRISTLKVSATCGLCLALASSPLLAAEDEWEFMIAPLFLWGMSLEGTSAIEGNALPLDLDFVDDVLDNLDAVLSFHFEARKNKLLLFAEYQYVSLDPTIEASLGPIPVSADIDFAVNMAELGAGYTVSQSENTRWEILGGLRWTDHDLEVDIDGPDPLPSRIEGGDDWYQGFVGGRVTRQLGEKWQLLARGDYGYGDSDNQALHLNAVVDYRFNNWGSAFIGYRYMDFDYDSGSYTYDALQQGPLIGIAIVW